MAILYKEDPINFFYTDLNYISAINEINGTGIYIIKGKRNRFA